MKKFFKLAGIIFFLIIVFLAAFVSARQYTTYDAPYPEIHASKDTAVLSRGKYIVTVLGHCGDCHSSNQTDDQFASLSGGRIFKLPIGTIQVPNITPDKETGIGQLTDGQVSRAIRFGVGHDGRALLPFMNFQNLTDHDLTAVLSYLRTLAPVSKKIWIRKFNLLGYVANAFLIRPAGPAEPPITEVTKDTTAAYGKYLALSVAGCRDCHTNRDLKSGAFIGPPFAGGFHMESEADPEHYEVISPNLTSDKGSGILAGWNERTFISRFKEGKQSIHSPMPWGAFKKMDTRDLAAIYKYLKTLKPVPNKVPETLVKISR